MTKQMEPFEVPQSRWNPEAQNFEAIPSEWEQKKAKFYEKINRVDVGRYVMPFNECKFLVESGDMFKAIGTAYAYGFLRGQRAERAKKRKSRPQAAPRKP